MSKRGNVPRAQPEPVSVEQSLRALVTAVVREELAKERAPVADEYVTVSEAAAYLRVVPATVRKWLRQGRLQRYSAGHDPRVKRSDLDRLLRSPVRRASRPSGPDLTPEQLARRDFG